MFFNIKIGAIIKVSSINPVKVGENLTISCSIQKACENEMTQWNWNYSTSDMKEMIIRMGDTGINTSYVISPVMESHNGTYECIANINGSVYMNNTLLSVKGIFVIVMIFQSDLH